MEHYSGYWIGEMTGTNLGNFQINLAQEGHVIQGIAKFDEPKYGKYEFSIKGIAGAELSLELTPSQWPAGVGLGPAKVIARKESEDVLDGEWTSIAGRGGKFIARRSRDPEKNISSTASETSQTKQKQKSSPMARVFGLPNASISFLDSPNDSHFKSIKNELLHPRTWGKTKIIGVCGVPGGGKTVLMNAVALDEDIRRKFIDGVFYVSCQEQELSLELVKQSLAMAFPEMARASDGMFLSMLEERKTLLIFDDPRLTQNDHHAVSALAEHNTDIIISTRNKIGLDILRSKVKEIRQVLLTPNRGIVVSNWEDWLSSGYMNVGQLLSSTEVGQSMQKRDEMGIRAAAAIANDRKNPSIDTRDVFEGYLLALQTFRDQSESDNDLIKLIWENYAAKVKASPGSKIELWRIFSRYQSKHGIDLAIPFRKEIQNVTVSAGLGTVIRRSMVAAAADGYPKGHFSKCHLLACLLGPRDWELDPQGAAAIQALSFDFPSLRKSFRSWVKRWHKAESYDEVDSALGLMDVLGSSDLKDGESVQLPAPLTASGYVQGPPGFSSEFCGVGGSEPVPDCLGVERLVFPLAELIALRETRLPLAVGLFGNWGSGKSHFMNLIDRRVKILTDQEKRRSLPGSGPWCREIVPIYFNAWHYVDANLWASLVTQIFDGLFRHVAGDTNSSEARKQRIEKLIAELQNANGATAAAEESLQIAKAAKLRAELEEQKAEAAARLAAQHREKLAGLVDGVLDNLVKLLPEAEMTAGWREAVRVLGLEDARKSYLALSTQVLEFRSLGGRVRAIGGAILAPDGRGGRIAWLIGAVILAPVIVGLGTWALTFWNVEIRKIGMFMGELTGLLAGVGSWLGVQLQRGRGLLDQVEGLQKAASKKRVLKLEDPKLKRSLAKVARCEEKEREARERVREARAKVRQLEEDLRELRPERRLFRFIEQRAQTEDYRSHLGLVSLVRRDFHELSVLFAEAQNKEVLSTGQTDRELLSNSIDRIVLFIDDLDRCQPEIVVDVLQAVHLLLAYPLFAVVVGVDQRCLKQSIEEQFKGLVQRSDPSKGREISATPLDYLEKIFHIPFHLPPMDKDGFGALIDRLTERQTARAPDLKTGNIGEEKRDALTGTTEVEDQSALRLHPQVVKSIGLPAEISSASRTEPLNPQSKASAVGSIPLEDWERNALKDYHPLIRTPRGTTRLLNTYRLVRAGIPAGEWHGFRGDGERNGEFRVAMFLLAVAAGYPAVARHWFDKLRNIDTTTFSLSQESQDVVQTGWPELKAVYDATFAIMNSQPTREIFSKWISRVERFTF